MKPFLAAASLAVLLAGCAHAQATGAPSPGFDIAITVDDLPDHGNLPANTTRLAIADSYLATLKAHHVPEAYGFVNAAGIEREPGTEAVLDHWRAAGYPLGNHTYSHMNIRTGGLAAFEADLEKGEPAVSSRMQGQDWHWLRFPFLSAGDGADHDGIIAYLKAHHYRIADVSMSFSDWAYTDPYTRCVAKGDEAGIAALKAQYMAGVKAEIARDLAMSQTVYGRQIKHVLLTHIGGFSALMLPRVLDALDGAGAHYVSLGEAESDPAYAETDARAGDGSVMERTAGEQGIDLSKLPTGGSIAGLDSICK